MSERLWIVKRSALIVSLCIVFVSGFVVSAQQPADQLTALASVFPTDNTLMFGAVRTDDAFITELDSALAPLYPLSEDLPPNFTLQTALDEAIADAIPNGSFATVIRPWLGDTAAVGIYIPQRYFDDPTLFNPDDLLDDSEGVIAVAVRDRGELEQALRFVAAANDVSLEGEERGIYKVYAVDDDTLIAISDTVMLIGEPEIMASSGVLGGDFSALGASEDFQAAIRALPDSGYNAVLYFSQPVFVETYTVIAANGTPAAQAEANESLQFMRQIASVSVGFTILDGRTFTADTAIAGGTLTLPDVGAVDLAFAGRIPATTPLMILSTNLRGTLETMFQTLDSVSEATDGEDLDDDLAELDNSVQVISGLTIEQITGWMTGDYALIAGLSETGANATSIFALIGQNPVDLGLLIDASADPAAAVAVVDAVEETLGGMVGRLLTEGEDARLDIDLSREMDVLTLVIRDLGGDVPFPLELQLGVQDDVFFLGTMGSADALRGGSSSLTDQPNFEQAQSSFLASSNAVYYVDFDNLASIIDVLAQVDAEEEDINNLRTVFAVVDSASITGSVDNGISRVRATITLAE